VQHRRIAINTSVVKHKKANDHAVHARFHHRVGESVITAIRPQDALGTDESGPHAGHCTEALSTPALAPGHQLGDECCRKRVYLAVQWKEALQSSELEL
jgi:hypothetical protein